MDKLLTLKEAAESLGLSEDKIRRLVEKGEIPAYQIGGMYLRFKEETINSLKRTRFHKSADSPAGAKSEFNEGQMSLFLKAKDFIYFNDFYIIAGLIIISLLYIILKSIR